MTLVDYKGLLLTRRANLQNELQERKKTLVLMESDLLTARRDVSLTEGALHATNKDLSDAETIPAAAQTSAAAPK